MVTLGRCKVGNMGNFKDLYIVKWLLQNTERSNGIKWQSREYNGMYFTNIGEGRNIVQVFVGIIYCRPTSKIVVKFVSPEFGEVNIWEPSRRIIPWGNKYDTDEENDLADALKRLMSVAGRQNAQQQLLDMENEEVRKQKIYERIFSGTGID